MAVAIPAGLNLNDEEQEAFYEMNRRERLRFNALPDNQSKLSYILALVDRKKSDREKSDLELKEIYGALYISVLISLTVLSATVYKNNEDKLKVFLVAMNALIFIVEIVMVAIKDVISYIATGLFKNVISNNNGIIARHTPMPYLLTQAFLIPLSAFFVRSTCIW
ncbi:1443_t:CDS:2 [Acaulospora morrowiae]|uniref:1443_t:CDS:1 n=1 Tax=Acaulospora morrowiae TaxID=94023 RepID=A0A9N9HUJ3_9GLOM|nr:1443_t:CDS:2 [Acaulospora morrowiae]